jgi:small-conductance mechanosensitive channel
MQDTTKSVGQYVSDFVTHIVNALPRFLGAVVIILIGYLVAKAVAAAVHNMLGRAQLNQRLHAGKGGNFIQKALPNPMGLIASLTYWVIYLFAISIAVSVLGIPVLIDFVRAIYAYIPNVIAAVLIFLVAGTISGAVATLVANAMGDTPTGKIVGTAAPVVIMSIASFMILEQLKIAPGIVLLTYGLVLGAACLGLALSFGLGGRDVASRMLSDLYDKAQANKGRVAADVRQGASRAKDKTDDFRDQAS